MVIPYMVKNGVGQLSTGNYEKAKERAELIGGTIKEDFKPDPNKSFKSSHWEEPNILAHVRINDRTDIEGRRLLHAEEIQADKGQEWQKLKRKIDAETATKEDIARFEFLDKNFPFNKNNRMAKFIAAKISCLCSRERIRWY